MSELPAIEKFESSTGARIYRIPMVLFPNGFVGYAYVVLDSGPPTLVDAGSGFGRSNDDLLAGIRALRDEFGESLDITDIQRILVTHGHIDHFGGVAFMLEQTGGAEIGIHRLDKRVLTNYEERVIIATKDLRIYLERAGINSDMRDSIIQMYSFAKQHVQSVPVSFQLQEDEPLDGMEFIHTPGHCPGQVCIKLGDVLLAADHILSQTTPHQAPESITHYMGLGHYADSLRKLRRVDGIRLSLGGHEDPVHDIYKRIEEIRASHLRKLDRIRNIVKNGNAPMTISDISKAMYPGMKGYDILLAIEEAGAHMEYLYEQGELCICNLHEVEEQDNPALLYKLA